MTLFISPVAIALMISFSAVAQIQPQVTIGHIAIVDTPGISPKELNKISHEVEGRTCTTKDAGIFIEDQVLEAFQSRGYFRAAVLEPRLKPSSGAGKLEANVVVEPGAQYRLANLEFRFGGQPVLSKTDLVPLITVHAGELFNTREVRQTLENLRKYYVARGYSKVAVVPQTIVNDEKKEITLSLAIQPEG